MVQNSKGANWSEIKSDIFPVTYDKCRVCGCERTVEMAAIEVEKKAGRLPPKAIPTYHRIAAVLGRPPDPLGLTLPPPQSVSGLIEQWGACADCGTARIIKAEMRSYPVGPGGQINFDVR